MPVPLITAGISTAAALLGNRKTGAEKAMEQTAKQQSALAGQVSTMANQQHSMSGPALQKAMQYYTQLASGNTGQINSLLAPDRAAAMQTYAGAQHGLDTMAPGASRDRALAQMQQQKAGQLGLMPMQARQNSFGQLAGMGQNLNNSANSMYGMAGNILQGNTETNSHLAEMQHQRAQGWASLGQNVGNIFMPWLKDKFGGAGGAGKRLSAPSMGAPQGITYGEWDWMRRNNPTF